MHRLSPEQPLTEVVVLNTSSPQRSDTQGWSQTRSYPLCCVDQNLSSQHFRMSQAQATESTTPVAEPSSTTNEPSPQPTKKSATKSAGRKKKRSLAQQQATARLIAFNQARRTSTKASTQVGCTHIPFLLESTNSPLFRM